MKWYKKLVGPEGLLNDCDEKHLIVCFTKKQSFGVEYQYAHFKSHEVFYPKYMTAEKKCFYEIISGPQKPHFDIDLTIKECNDTYNTDAYIIADTLVSAIIKSCLHIINITVNDILIYNSHGQDKLSFHIIINHHIHRDNLEAKAFYNLVYDMTSSLLAGQYVEFMDSSVYKTNQAFRLLHSHKYDNLRIKKCHDFTYQDQVIGHEGTEMEQFGKSLITNIVDCQWLPSFKTEVITPIYKDISENEYLQISKLLKLKFKNLFTIREIKDNQVFLLAPSYYCPVCKKVHEHENPRIRIVDHSIQWNCRRSSHWLTLGEIEEDDSDKSEDHGGYLHIGVKLKSVDKVNFTPQYLIVPAIMIPVMDMFHKPEKKRISLKEIANSISW